MMDTSAQQSMGYSGAFNNPSAISIRIDTDPLIEKYRRELTGSVLVVESDANGKPLVTDVKVGRSLVNAEGVQCLLARLSSLVNNHALQANLSDDRYRLYMKMEHRNVAIVTMFNKHRWGISSADYKLLCNIHMNYTKIILTRPIDNKERDSYSQTMRHDEKHTYTQPDKGFSIPYFGGGNNATQT